MLRSGKSRWRAGAIAAGAAATLLLPAGAWAAQPTADPAAADPARLAKKLVREVKVDAMNRHLIALQRLSDRNGGRRAASTPGHEASATYVHDKLVAAGYNVSYQEFPFVYEETLAEAASVVSPTPRALKPIVMQYSPNTPVGGITAPLAVLPVDATPGCEAADFAGGTYTGAIVLIQRGACTFTIKQQNAADAGAVAVLVYNNTADPNEELHGRLGTPEEGRVPIAGLTRAEGEALTADAAAATLTVSLELRVLREDRVSRNVIAETPGGRADNVVMSGAHLDSVAKGPGINDNGTGSAAQLELALQLANHPVKNKVRFAWWSAEEFGLVGSTYYVGQLSFEQQLDIALYLNFDMLGSPNFARFIYDGDNSDATGAGPGPYGSAQIEDVFEGYFDSVGLAHEGTDFSGRSDYGPFIAAAIPAGGLFTGAEGKKTAAQAALYGGTADQAYDSCYHQACDTLGNVNRTVLDQNADAVAWAVGLFALDTSAVNGNGSPTVRAQRRQAAKLNALSRTATATTHDAAAG